MGGITITPEEITSLMGELDSTSTETESAVPQDSNVHDSSLIELMASQAGNTLEVLKTLGNLFAVVTSLAHDMVGLDSDSSSSIGGDDSSSGSFDSTSTSDTGTDSRDFFEEDSTTNVGDEDLVEENDSQEYESTTTSQSTEDDEQRRTLLEQASTTEPTTSASQQHPLEQAIGGGPTSALTPDDYKGIRDSEDAKAAADPQVQAVTSTGVDYAVSGQSPETSDQVQTTTSSASEPLAAYSGTSADGGTGLSASKEETNSYVGYSADDHKSSGTFPDSARGTSETKLSSNGVSMTPDSIDKLNKFADEASGKGIFKSITYTPYYDESYGGGDMGFSDGGGMLPEYTGDSYSGQFSVGAPVDVGALTEGDVTFERPVDGSLSKEEISMIFDEALAKAGVTDPAAVDKWKGTLDLIAQHESNYSPAAANGWDSNANGATQSDGYPANSSRGLMQTIPGTFAANHLAGTSTSIYDPVASVGASIMYLMNRYGCDQMGNGLDEFYSARVPTYHGY